MIEINKLTFKYQTSEKNALENISLKIEEGDFVGIIGESGAGKTTLCSAINALIPHHYKGDYYGSVRVCGTDTFDTTAGQLALTVGSVFQDIESQLITTVVEDELLFALENFGFSKDDIYKRIDETLNEMEISDLRYKEISSLSGGQKQKVAIAAILALQPKILLLDEPTGELDPASSLQIFKILQKLNKEKGITVIVVEQKIMLLCEFAKKLIVMQEGKITEYDEVRKVLGKSDELEKIGINIPRVVTLYKRLKDQGLLTNGSQLPLNAKEASDLIKSLPAYKTIDEKRKITKEEEINDDVVSADVNGDGRKIENSLEESTVINFNNVSFSYHHESCINDVSVNVNKGDFIAIIGSNGAGKSTFSKLCNGLLKPTSGDVEVLGFNTKKTKTSKLAKHIGFLFQNPDRQICCNSVKEEIEFSLKNIGLSLEEVQKRTEETLKEFNLNPSDEPFYLSRGQRQKLCLACLIALKSEILILDEPTTGLDYKECMELMEKIKVLNKNGTTVIMVCHDMEVVLDFATKVFVMTNGSLIAQGKTRDILADEKLLSSARLLAPQIAQTSNLLGTSYEKIFEIEELIHKLKGFE